MPDAKTKPGAASVAAHLAAVPSDAQRADAEALITLMRQITQADPVMWGSSIIGFGSYHYRYASGREGDSPLAGFALRKAELAVYIMAGLDNQADLLARLGRHKAAKACLYIKRLSDIDTEVLAQLISDSVHEMKRRYPAST